MPGEKRRGPHIGTCTQTTYSMAGTALLTPDFSPMWFSTQGNKVVSGTATVTSPTSLLDYTDFPAEQRSHINIKHIHDRRVLVSDSI